MSNRFNQLVARMLRLTLFSLTLVSGCSALVPSARVSEAQFSRAAVVSITLREWKLFGATVNDDDHLNWDKPERNEGLWQRVREYWWVGMNPGTPESRWSGKYDGNGNEFRPEEDERYAWSAAFVSFVMRSAGAGAAFPYGPDHAAYINAAKRMTLGTDRLWLVTAERPSAYAPVPGDLICYGRDYAASLRYDDLPAQGLFPAHCDIVVGPPISGEISVVGGNVHDSVTMRHVPVTVEGKLAGQDGVVLDKRQTWMAVLRVHEPGVGSSTTSARSNPPPSAEARVLQKEAQHLP